MIKKIYVGFENIAEDYADVVRSIVTRRLSERAGVQVSDHKNEYKIIFKMTSESGCEQFQICPQGNGITIEANTKSALLTGFGSFLRNCRLYPDEGFVPTEKAENHIFENSFRGMYFATHNHNFYEDAPIEEISTLMEDLSLWGLNVICVWFDMSQQFPTDQPETVNFLHRIHAIFEAAKRIGIETAFTSNANEAFPDSPKELRAEWMPQGKYFAEIISHYHIEICPSKEGGLDRILHDRRKCLELIKDFPVDYFFTGPYDQGGCTCEKCAPWGARGYLKTARAIYPLIKEYFPKIKFGLSSWYFDHFVVDEWTAFQKELESGDYRDWVSYIIGFFDVGESVPEFLRKGNGVAGIPMIEFSEISMYGAKPWGGFGANPMAKKFTAVREHTEGVFQGCLPYSEGAYEDINKVMVLGRVSGLLTDEFETFKQYAKLEFSSVLAEDIAKLLKAEDEGLLRVRMDDEAEVPGTVSVRFGIYFVKYIDYAFDLARSIDNQLDEKTKAGWKWRIIYLRALIDHELYHNNWYMTANTVRYMEELTAIYHAGKANYFVCPPTPESLCRNGVHLLGSINEKLRRCSDIGEQGKNG